MRISDWSSDVCSSDLFSAGHPLEEARQRACERVRLRVGAAVRLGEGTREVRRRHEVAPQRLGQGAEQRRHLVGDEVRCLPRPPRGVKRSEERCGGKEGARKYISRRLTVLEKKQIVKYVVTHVIQLLI